MDRFLTVIYLVLLVGCQTNNREQRNSGLSDLDAVHKKRMPIEDFTEWLKPVPQGAFLSNQDYYIWGASVVKGGDGLYHMFYSRWKQEYKFQAWVTHSEIAHAIAESPTGPFKFKNVALPPRGAQFWDGLTTHNPTVHKINNKYYLYYMGTTGDGKAMDELNFVHRNNQRIGVAWADDPNGPWHRADQPLIDVSNDDQADDALMVSNPSVTAMKNGKILLIYKAVAKHNPLPFGGPVTHQAAIAESPLGPYTKYNKRIFYKEGEKFPSEDPYIWYQADEDTYYAIVKDNYGTFTNEGTSLALFKSKDGLDWEVAKNPLVSKIEICRSDGVVEKVSKLERPQVLMEDGIPIVLYCAVAYGNPMENLTKNVHIPLINFKTNE